VTCLDVKLADTNAIKLIARGAIVGVNYKFNLSGPGRREIMARDSA